MPPQRLQREHSALREPEHGHRRRLASRLLDPVGERIAASFSGAGLDAATSNHDHPELEAIGPRGEAIT